MEHSVYGFSSFTELGSKVLVRRGRDSQSFQPVRVEAMLLSFHPVRAILFDNWGEASEDTHRLVDALDTNRSKVAEPLSYFQ